MFIGHLAVAFAAKRLEPKLSLPLLLVAADFPDLLWPILVLLGVEHSRVVPGITKAAPLDLYDIPYSHSLATSLLWSALFAAPWLLRRDRRAALVLSYCVLSHFVLDWITHRPDLPFAPGLPYRFGLGLWNSLPLSILVEAALFVLGVGLYARSTRATNRVGNIGFWAMVLLLFAIWLVGPFGPPPPSIEPVVISSLATIVLVAIWAFYVDRRRVVAGA